MNNDNRVWFEFNWWKGMKIKMPNSNFLKVCIGIAILSIAISWSACEIIKAIAPHGFF